MAELTGGNGVEKKDGWTPSIKDVTKEISVWSMHFVLLKTDDVGGLC